MTLTIKATYQDGVLRPAEPLPLREGETVDVTVLQAPSEATAEPAPNSEQIARWLEEIAALPNDGPVPDDGLSGSRDHDKILYGGPKGAL